MKEYKRLTEILDIETKEIAFQCDIPTILKRLAELEDKIEQGLMLELPCKEGDRIYCISCVWNKNGKFIGEIYKARANGFYIAEKGFIQIEDNIFYDYYNLGVDVFLTKAEAEAKLKELQNER